MFISHLMDELAKTVGTNGKKASCYAIGQFLSEKYPQYSWPVHQLKAYEQGKLVPGPNKGIALIEAVESLQPIPYCLSLSTDAVINSKKVSDYAVVQHVVAERLMYRSMNIEPPVNRIPLVESMSGDILPPDEEWASESDSAG